MTNFAEKAAEARGFSVVFDACAEAFLDEPDEAIIDDVRKVAAALGQDGFDFVADDDLKQRYYDRLFVTSTPYYVPLIESSVARGAEDEDGVMRYASIQSDLTDHVLRCYHTVEFDFQALSGYDLAVKSLHPDSLASELAFLAFCKKREAECWESSDEAQAEHWAQLAAQFSKQHAGRWVGKAADCLARTDEDFYAHACALAAAAAEALLEETE